MQRQNLDLRNNAFWARFSSASPYLLFWVVGFDYAMSHHSMIYHSQFKRRITLIYQTSSGKVVMPAASRRLVDKGADGLAVGGVSDVVLLQGVEDDDRQLVLHSQAERRFVHHANGVIRHAVLE